MAPDFSKCGLLLKQTIFLRVGQSVFAFLNGGSMKDMFYLSQRNAVSELLCECLGQISLFFVSLPEGFTKL